MWKAWFGFTYVQCGKAWFGINDPSWLEFLKQSTIYNTGFSQEELTKDAIGKARCMNHHDPMNMRTSQNKNPLPSSQWLDQTCTSIQVGEKNGSFVPLKNGIQQNNHLYQVKQPNKVDTNHKSDQFKIKSVGSKNWGRIDIRSMACFTAFVLHHGQVAQQTSRSSSKLSVPASQMPTGHYEPKGQITQHSHRFAFCKWSRQDG